MGELGRIMVNDLIHVTFTQYFDPTIEGPRDSLSRFEERGTSLSVGFAEGNGATENFVLTHSLSKTPTSL